MSRLRIGVVRYATVAESIARQLGAAGPVPDVTVGHGRVTLTFRRLGGTRWPESEQVEHALRAAAAARTVLAADDRAAVRQRATRAIVVAYEDAALVRGCAVTARWECVVPAAPTA